MEGYFHGDVEEAHEEFQKELNGAGYDILFDEVEAPDDSEISWKGEGRTGQVAMRNECGDDEKTYVHITNRPAYTPSPEGWPGGRATLPWPLLPTRGLMPDN